MNEGLKAEARRDYTCLKYSRYKKRGERMGLDVGSPLRKLL